MINITTDRLIIRDHIVDDLKDLHKLISDNEVMYFLPETKTTSLAESKKNLTTAIEEINKANRTKFFFAIINKKNNSYIGEIGVTKTAECSEGNIMNLGYFIIKDYWGRGIIPEASKAVISYAFDFLGTVKIETGCAKLNNKSERVMNKIGLIKEAELKQHSVINNKFYDRVEYRVLKEEWNN
ncbi:GNAT family N-acetyltransferase [Clostridium sp. 'deep sea']|uniref:GNAT family N-acetyltransferase n=1 Tax=Clostridium sp. 'deep sea' TaxID=2779445 RepID=UPI0018969753|nr:GNAT family protein [Clostridium sp. 'deep sea']QOR36106.1 GNAT family N-acetyltransferase [Clostridium sp. 'deep sea']